MTEHYFSAQPGAASKPRTIDVRLAGRQVSVTTDSGVFSPAQLDQGTAVLLGHLPVPPSGNLLDLGCGWGAITLQAALQAADAGTRTRVWALDVNERSLGLTARNVADLGLANVNTVTAEQIPAGTEFSAIWSNPPIRIGKDALHALLETWLPRLAPGGQAWLVVAKKLGADSLRAWLAATFPEFTVAKRAQSKGYHVIVVDRDRR